MLQGVFTGSFFFMLPGVFTGSAFFLLQGVFTGPVFFMLPGVFTGSAFLMLPGVFPGPVFSLLPEFFSAREVFGGNVTFFGASSSLECIGRRYSQPEQTLFSALFDHLQSLHIHFNCSDLIFVLEPLECAV